LSQFPENAQPEKYEMSRRTVHLKNTSNAIDLGPIPTQPPPNFDTNPTGHPNDNERDNSDPNNKNRCCWGWINTNDDGKFILFQIIFMVVLFPIIILIVLIWHVITDYIAPCCKYSFEKLKKCC
jgi:hypothetical protein